MQFTHTLNFSTRIRLTVTAEIDLQADTTTLTHAEVEGDPSHENLLGCFTEQIMERIAALTLKAFEASVVEAE